MELSNDSGYIASCDTLKKINVVTWPNVFNLQSVLLEHSLPIQNMCMVGNDTIASLSEANAGSKKQDLILSKTLDARVVSNSKVQGVKGLAQSSRGTLILVSDDNSASEMQVDGSQAPSNIDLRSQEEIGAYSGVFLAKQSTGLPSLLLQANYSDLTGCIEEKADAQADIVLKTL